jgi:alpha-aminoadipate carrier protein LysW
MAVVAACPTCAGEVELVEGTEVSEILECPECGAELEVESLSPPKVVDAPEEEEDWGE